MNVTFSCPKCDEPNRLALSADAHELTCAHCGQSIAIPGGAFSHRHVNRCLVCPSTDLYLRKDFPQRLGVGLVAVGIIGSSIAWAYQLVGLTFGVLFATALIDVVLYALVGNSLMCYRCRAEYRGMEESDDYGGFNLETHERHRQAAARASQPH